MLENISKKATSCLVCGVQKPVRNHYFDGKLLTSRDFIDEQDYNRVHRHLHNSLLHGTGTVCGLKLIQHPSAECRNSFVVIESGMALDCCGQEILVPEPTLIRVRELIEQDRPLQLKLDGNHDLVISIVRCDTMSEPMPILLPGCDGEVGATEYGRVCEGFEFKLSVRSSSASDAHTIASQPKLKWVHSISLGSQSPTALHVNNSDNLLQIAADNDAGGAQLYAHSLLNHDLVSLLEAPETTSDTASSRIARLLFCAGGGEASSGVSIWRQDDIDNEAKPAAVLDTKSAHARIAVSPTSGALYVLDQQSNTGTRLLSYTAEAINTWLDAGPLPDTQPDAIATLRINQIFGDETSAYRRGASMISVSPNGRWLAILAQNPRNANTTPLYLIDTAAFNTGGMSLADARAQVASPDLTSNEQYCSVDWSLDSQRLYIMSSRTEDAAAIHLNRYTLTGSGNTLEQSGRGVTLSGNAIDMAVAPTERRLYVLIRSLDDKTIITTVDNERIKAFSDDGPEALTELDGFIEIDGIGQSLTITPNGATAYIAATDAAPEDRPDRGLVAVIDISEGDCGKYFSDPLEGCDACAPDNSDHSVAIGHLKKYIYNETTKPNIKNAGEKSENDVEIDNWKYRSIVPSSTTLKLVTDCILEQGIAEGPPGPRGDRGIDGTDGLSIDTVEVEAIESDSAPSGEVTANGTGLTLTLEIPSGNEGDSGTPGRSIDDVDVNIIPAGTPASGSTTVDPDTDSLILTLNIPSPDAADPVAPQVNRIVGMSWDHAQQYPIDPNIEFGSFLMEEGIAVVFENEVPWQSFTQLAEPGDNPMLVELQRQVEGPNGTFFWSNVSFTSLHPILEFTLNGTLINSKIVGDSTTVENTKGFVLRLNENVFGDTGPETLRLVFYTDFVGGKDNAPLDGSHLNGTLPTGQGAPGDTFRSWFHIGKERE